ncbi:MAG: hypothetical protein IPP66_11130 [Anaerolineales bacterium]|nr:hypothetical protein [Anaerolineales bacterium]
MEDIQIKLSALWVATMLTYLLGDVLRIFSGDTQTQAMKEQITKFTQPMWLLIASLMVLPIVMVVLCVTLPYPANRWVNIIMAGFFLLFNLIGLPTYPSAYDRFLIAVSLVFNGITIWYAWNWIPQAF